PALADGVAGDAFVAAEDAAVEMDDVAGLGALRAQAVDDRGVAAFGDETDVLTVWLFGDGEDHGGGDAAHDGLFQAPQREAQEIELGRGRGEQEVALVARGIDGAAQLWTVRA